MIVRTILFSCDDPDCKVGHFSLENFATIDLARKAGWAISRDRRYCYCPNCAPKHRNVGRYSYFGNGNLQVNGSK